MKLYEFQAKQIFSRFGIPVPPGKMAESPEAAAEAALELGGRVVVKAQVHAGGRGKAGLIKLADNPEQAAEHARAILGRAFKGFLIQRVLVEQAQQFTREYYLALLVDRASKRPLMMASAKGGVDIEEVAATEPEAIARLTIDPAFGPFGFELRDLIARAGFDPTVARQIVAIGEKLYRVFVETDAALAEINPLMVTQQGHVVAADAKFDVDDNALFRHQDLLVYKEEAEEDPIEAEAHRRGVTYVHLNGDIGIIGNGAGLVMGTLDMVTRNGGRPANFLDVGGGAKADLVRQVLEIVLLDKNVKAILINIFGGITRGDEVARGVLDATSSMDISVPIVVRMAGTRADEGLKMLEGTSLIPVGDPEQAARRAIELARQREAAA